MIEEICRELNNWFDRKSDGTDDRYFGTFVISDGAIDLSETDIVPNQYFRIVGSRFNDGVYKYEPEVGAPTLTDETFDGAVWAMAVPPSVIALAAEIEAWQEKYGVVDSPAMSPYTSESFGGYSYSKASRSGSNGADSSAVTWQGAFANRLSRWRKIRAI